MFGRSFAQVLAVAKTRRCSDLIFGLFSGLTIEKFKLPSRISTRTLAERMSGGWVARTTL